MSDYEAFIASKRKKLQPMGFKPIGELNPSLFDWQATVVDWAIRRGRAALFEECVAASTVIGTDGKTVEELADRGSAGDSFSLSGCGVRRSSTTIPWIGGRSSMYRIVTSSGRSIDVTMGHRFATPSGWVYACDLSCGDSLLVSDAFHLRSSLEPCQSVRAEDGLSFLRTTGDSICGYSACHHPRDGRLHHDPVIDRSSFPLLADARERSHHELRSDGRLHEPLHIRPCRSTSRHSMTGSACALETYSLAGEEYQVASSGNICPLDCDRSSSQSPLRECHREPFCESSQRPSQSKSVVVPCESPFVFVDTVHAVYYIGRQDFYHVHVPIFSNYLANGFWSHNCGLGKTLQQLAWAEQVVRHTNKPVILHCPVGVRHQTKREADKFGIGVDVVIANDSSQVVNGINLVNYEKLHHFDTSLFAGVVLDESSILKNYTGKIKRQLIESYARTPFRLACTATPAPNDHMELGNHSDFLGVMPSNEMLSRWFINDTMKAGGYRLKKHGQRDFWKWVASWAVCVGKPSDIGGDDSGFDLPELVINRHTVTVDPGDPPPGMLINTSGISATTIHEEKRLTNNARTSKAAELVHATDEAFLIWCDTNYEADQLKEKIADAVDVRGTDSESKKESAFLGFASGEIKRLITKPSVAGFGMNWQHCHRQVFTGLSYSFEQYYQAVRRCWRFGQDRPVFVDIVLADTESAIESAIARKESDHALMKTGMADAMRSATMDEISGEIVRDEYRGTVTFEIPHFLKRQVEC